ncbi:hypothetical protein [Methanocorpusculum vombati]|uniref:hypothetical protein n=1 Tax=Methanocorpusculum vombati TaxID=3002864 RepID=UPI0022A7A6EE|nr:hypothetical protein [Methanocorpusculum vombati]MCZ9320148.1 hypothetical protein [Methanocorpusculum sp.]MDE2547702.1 hypothetical protein [Methanocorpusculum sp.]
MEQYFLKRCRYFGIKKSEDTLMSHGVLYPIVRGFNHQIVSPVVTATFHKENNTGPKKPQRNGTPRKKSTENKTGK